MTAWYNEIDPYAAQWLRNLISAGHIAPGDVDERDIRDVHPDDLRRYSQCHFFAGIGVWSHALRLAGWPDDRPVWTGSCPCPPFSAAGKGQQCPACGSKRNLCHPRKTGHFVCLACGCDRHADARHLWPEFSRLIRERDAPVVFGEQVASADGRLWLDVVSADLRLASYGFAGADLCAAGVGAPHIRQRLWWVGERLADAARSGRREERAHAGRQPVGNRTEGFPAGSCTGSGDSRPRPTDGFRRDADWLFCRDGKWRPVEPGTFPLAHGAPARVGRLRAYGNAIVAQAAATFINAYLDMRAA